jgi:hypothetical protein
MCGVKRPDILSGGIPSSGCRVRIRHSGLFMWQRFCVFFIMVIDKMIFVEIGDVLKEGAL